MDKKKTLLLLHICYWVGAIIDGLVIIPMLSPDIAGILFGIQGFNPGPEYRYAMGMGASLMAGWTFLLVWADRRPFERNGILLLTVFPVLFGLIASGIYSVNSGFIDIDLMGSRWVMQAVLVILFLFGYAQSRRFSNLTTM